MGCLWSRLPWHNIPLSIPVLFVAVGDYRPVICLPFYCRFYLLDSKENVFSRTCVLPNIQCIFSAGSCSLGNLSLRTNLQKPSTVCRNVQLIWMGGGTFRRPRLGDKQTDLFDGVEFIGPDVLFKTTKAEAIRKRRGYPYRCPSGVLGRTVPSTMILK